MEILLLHTEFATFAMQVHVVSPDPPPRPAACREAMIEIAVEGAVIRVPPGADGATLATILHTLKSLR
jgi:transposase